MKYKINNKTVKIEKEGKTITMTYEEIDKIAKEFYGELLVEDKYNKLKKKGGEQI